MTVAELKKKCDAMIADGYSDSEIILAIPNGDGDKDDYCWLTGGFSSPIYNSPNINDFLEFSCATEDNCVVLN